MTAETAQDPRIDQAIDLLQGARSDEAHALLLECVKADPTNGRAHALIGVCHAQAGNLEASVRSLETAVLLLPDDTAIQYNLANALAQAGRSDQARWRLQRILDTDPQHADARQLWDYLNQGGTHSAVATAVEVPMSSSGSPRPVIGEMTPLDPSAPRSSNRPGLTPKLIDLKQQQQRLQQGITAEHPPLGLRMLRGWLWGMAWGQVWTVSSGLAALLISLFNTRVDAAVATFVVLIVMLVIFNAVMGALLGLIIAVTNSGAESGRWIGVCVAFLILLIGVFFGMLNFASVVVTVIIGMCVGSAIGARVEAPVVRPAQFAGGFQSSR